MARRATRAERRRFMDSLGGVEPEQRAARILAFNRGDYTYTVTGSPPSDATGKAHTSTTSPTTPTTGAPNTATTTAAVSASAMTPTTTAASERFQLRPPPMGKAAAYALAKKRDDRTRATAAKRAPPDQTQSKRPAKKKKQQKTPEALAEEVEKAIAKAAKAAEKKAKAAALERAAQKKATDRERRRQATIAAEAAGKHQKRAACRRLDKRMHQTASDDEDDSRLTESEDVDAAQGGGSCDDSRQRTRVDINVVEQGRLSADGYRALNSDGESSIDSNTDADPDSSDSSESETERNQSEDEASDAETSLPPGVLPRSEMAVFAHDRKKVIAMRTNGWESQTTPTQEKYPYLADMEKSGPTPPLLALAESPLDLFLFFMPKKLWRKIANESNRYRTQNLVPRVDKMYNKQGDAKKRTKEELMEREAKIADIEPHEILRCIGLLVARMLSPHRRHLYDHWATVSVGAVPRGTFGQFLPRNRFALVMQNLHFTNNTNPRAATDRAWKIRSVIDTLQRTFLAGFEAPAVVAFDEAMIPLMSRHNPTRQYMADKPHKWGTKLFMTCCARSAYCIRFEVYCGKSDQDGNSSADPNLGPAAVLRNLDVVLPKPRAGVYHAVVMDRFYTSVQLAFELLHRRVYCIGTIRTDRIGFPNELRPKPNQNGKTPKSTKRPADIPRGTSIILTAKNCPQMAITKWWDNKAVLVLATGASTALETCERRVRGGSRESISCPSFVRDYQRWMGGVDIHDQLRLQRYSLQMQVRFQKYYKALFLGLVDIAIVNAFIVYREAHKKRDGTTADHSRFMRELQAQLLELEAADFDDDGRPSGAPNAILKPVSKEHEPKEVEEYQVIGNNIRRRRQRQCKVCSVYKKTPGQRQQTKYYCQGCSPTDTSRIFLCNRVWPHFRGNTMTCHQIWHYKWDYGSKVPKARHGRGFQLRESGRPQRTREKARSRTGGGRASDGGSGSDETEEILVQDDSDNGERIAQEREQDDDAQGSDSDDDARESEEKETAHESDSDAALESDAAHESDNVAQEDDGDQLLWEGTV